MNELDLIIVVIPVMLVIMTVAYIYCELRDQRRSR